MATLVLTVVGGAIGGPIGAALGASLGQAVDRNLLFAPTRREGPRLTELAVQTSSYGAPIAKLFGTVRVAGTVIWATDLIESRATSRAGKGQPSTTTYSYSASFAVALSSRPIRGVRRIWADGKLLRGAAGDFKTQTAFRLHTGGEDQPVDPLIGSAVSDAPAHRGIAYAVFEGLQLADFGNRIPSLTFEVVADEGAGTIGGIAGELAPEMTGATAAVLDGFAATGGSVRDVVALLGEVGGVTMAARGGAIAMRDAVGAAEAIVTDQGVRASGGRNQARRQRSVAAIEGVPRQIVVRHYDAARDYQTGSQRARRPGAGYRETQVDVPAVMTADTAKGMAAAMLLRAEAERTRRVIRTDLSALGIGPGTIVGIAGEHGLWRVVEARWEAMLVQLTLVPLPGIAPTSSGASSGHALPAPDAVAGTTILHAFETPALSDEALTAPQMTIVATGTGAAWRRAALLYSLDNGASWIAAGSTAAPATIGQVTRIAAAAPATLFDRAGSWEVALCREDMALEDADDDRLDAGANLALIGDELVQFGRAEPLGDGRWCLSRLLRGRRGTEDAIGRQGIGDRFVLIEADAARIVPLPMAALGTQVRVLATGTGDVAAPVEAALVLSGASLRPPSPVGLTVRETVTGEVVVRWTRRSRLGWRWSDGVDAPLGEESEAYRITLSDDGGERAIETVSPMLVLAAPDRAAGPVKLAIRQHGALAESLPLRGRIPNDDGTDGATDGETQS